MKYVPQHSQDLVKFGKVENEVTSSVENWLHSSIIKHLRVYINNSSIVMPCCYTAAGGVGLLWLIPPRTIVWAYIWVVSVWSDRRVADTLLYRITGDMPGLACIQIVHYMFDNTQLQVLYCLMYQIINFKNLLAALNSQHSVSYTFNSSRLCMHLHVEWCQHSGWQAVGFCLRPSLACWLGSTVLGTRYAGGNICYPRDVQCTLTPSVTPIEIVAASTRIGEVMPRSTLHGLQTPCPLYPSTVNRFSHHAQHQSHSALQRQHKSQCYANCRADPHSLNVSQPK